ncbi:quinone oxidoreductase [Candidatus Berkelbacteria bacterium]|nr:quinone oxidoreductase [Candidatus Berkelbacteria bacterium]
MMAVVVSRYGGPEVLEVVKLTDPVPRRGEVLVRNSYAGISYGDIYIRNGTYRPGQLYGRKPPFVLGLEGGGVVEKLGPGVRGLQPGEPVAYCLSGGSYAEYTVVSANGLVKVPKELSLRNATAVMLHGCTAHYLINSITPLKRGAACLIHAGAGSCGQLMIQMAKQRGLKVFTTVGSLEKERIVKDLGADVSILYRSTDFYDVVKKETNGEGVDIVFDSVGRDTFERSIRCVRTRGTCVLFGASSGPVESISPVDLAEAGSVYFVRPHVAHFIGTARELRMRANSVFSGLIAGHLRVHLDREMPLEEAAKAHELIEARHTSGKVVLSTLAATEHPSS